METERIFLRNFEKSDAKAVFAYRSLPEVAEYQYWEPFTEDRALSFVTRYADTKPNKRGIWIAWAVIDKKSRDFIGDCALKIDGDKAEIGCNIAPCHQHWGYAKEILHLLFNYCFEKAGVTEISGITDSENIVSVRLMESLQMTRLPDFEEKVICKGRLSIEHKYSIRKIENRK